MTASAFVMLIRSYQSRNTYNNLRHITRKITYNRAKKCSISVSALNQEQACRQPPSVRAFGDFLNMRGPVCACVALPKGGSGGQLPPHQRCIYTICGSRPPQVLVNAAGH